MVLVRFAYGFLNKLRLHSISVQTMPLRSPMLFTSDHPTTGCCPTDSQAISCLLGECVSSMCSSRIVLPWFLCSLRLRLDFQL